MFVTRPFFFLRSLKHKHCLILTQIAHFSNPHIFFRRYVFNNANRIEVAAAAKVQGQRADAEKPPNKQTQMDSKI